MSAHVNMAKLRQYPMLSVQLHAKEIGSLEDHTDEFIQFGQCLSSLLVATYCVYSTVSATCVVWFASLLSLKSCHARCFADFYLEAWRHTSSRCCYSKR